MFQLDKKKYDQLFYVILVVTLVLGFAWVFNLVPSDKAKYVGSGLAFVGGKLFGLLFNSKGE